MWWSTELKTAILYRVGCEWWNYIITEQTRLKIKKTSRLLVYKSTNPDPISGAPIREDPPAHHALHTSTLRTYPEPAASVLLMDSTRSLLAMSSSSCALMSDIFPALFGPRPDSVQPMRVQLTVILRSEKNLYKRPLATSLTRIRANQQLELPFLQVDSEVSDVYDDDYALSQ